MRHIFQFLLGGLALLVIPGCQQMPIAEISTDQRSIPLTFENMVVFGDSYSDNGNVFRLTHGYYPGKAYCNGRFSDGPTWSEYFARSIQVEPNDPNHFLNFAYGQAQISAPYTIDILKNGEKISYSIPDLDQQITTYLRSPVERPEKSLFVVFIGTNDLLNLADTKDHQKLIQMLLSKQQKQLNRLISNGAKYLLVVNMRNLSLTPYVCGASEDMKTHPNVSPEDYKASYVKLIEAYNSELANQLQGQNILTFDAYTFDTTIHKKIIDGGFPYQFQGKSYTLKYAGDGCYLSHAHISCYINNGNYQQQVSPICPDPADYFYYDRAHPTTFVHNLMAEAVYEECIMQNQKQ